MWTFIQMYKIILDIATIFPIYNVQLLIQLIFSSVRVFIDCISVKLCIIMIYG